MCQCKCKSLSISSYEEAVERAFCLNCSSWSSPQPASSASIYGWLSPFAGAILSCSSINWRLVVSLCWHHLVLLIEQTMTGCLPYLSRRIRNCTTNRHKFAFNLLWHVKNMIWYRQYKNKLTLGLTKYHCVSRIEETQTRMAFYRQIFSHL
jgi:hypothetical protein